MTEKAVPVKIRRLEASELYGAKKTLVKAFYHDPTIKYLIRDENKRPKVTGHSLEGGLRQGLAYGEVYTTGELDGVAIWIYSEKKPTLIKSIRSGLILPAMKTIFGLGWSGLNRYVTMTGLLLKMHKRVAPGPHYYLSIIGVDPASQGKGLGAELLKPVLEKAKTAGLACYLETSDENTIPFYRKQGFEISEEITLPDGGLRIRAMVKKPG